jgi:hypothetical protein
MPELACEDQVSQAQAAGDVHLYGELGWQRCHATTDLKDDI